MKSDEGLDNEKALALLRQGCDELSLQYSQLQLQQWLKHMLLMLAWNRTHNLTAMTALEEMVIKHILDALSIASLVSEADSCLDVGTGGGIPGLPLAIYSKRQHWTLLDASHKRTSFVRTVSVELGLTNITVVTERVEQWLPDKLFDMVTVRAFADPPKALEQVAKLVKPGGTIALMLGRRVAESALRSPTLVLESLQRIEVPFLQGERHLALVKRQ